MGGGGGGGRAKLTQKKGVEYLQEVIFARKGDNFVKNSLADVLTFLVACASLLHVQLELTKAMSFWLRDTRKDREREGERERERERESEKETDRQSRGGGEKRFHKRMKKEDGLCDDGVVVAPKKRVEWRIALWEDGETTSASLCLSLLPNGRWKHTNAA